MLSLYTTGSLSPKKMDVSTHMERLSKEQRALLFMKLPQDSEHRFNFIEAFDGLPRERIIASLISPADEARRLDRYAQPFWSASHWYISNQCLVTCYLKYRHTIRWCTGRSRTVTRIPSDKESPSVWLAQFNELLLDTSSLTKSAT